MKKRELNNNEQEILVSIKNMANHILNDYRMLQKIKRDGSREEHQEALENLKHDLFLEESLYQRIGNNRLVVEEMLHSLKENKSIEVKDVGFVITSALNNDQELLIRKRIIIRLINYWCFLINDTSYELTNACNLDLLNTFLTILNIYLEDTNYKDYKDLEMLKYNLAFLNPDLEKDLIDHDMQINPIIYWSSDVIASLSSIPVSLSHLERIIRASKVFNEAYAYLIENYFNMHSSTYLINKIVLRAMAIVLEKEDILERRRDIEEILSGPLNYYGSNLKKILLECLASYENDQELVQQISLILNK